MPVSAPVFDVQRFSLHDGPGIRSLVFLKGCGLHCAWCQNPESQSTRPVIAFYGDRCLGSFDCAAVCPNDAILRGDYRIDQEKCNRCGLCVEACANGALRLIGEELTPEELMERLMADLPYYENSGGGITFTGGEPTLHPRFVKRVLELCGESGIHTNLETAGKFVWTTWEPILRLLDLIYFDLKILDEAGHRQNIGPGFTGIVDNARRLVAGGFPVEFRMPLVPGLTDTPQNIDSVIGFLHDIDRPSIHLLEYHNMGEAKIDIIQGCQPKLGLGRYSDDRLDVVRREFLDRGIEVPDPS